MLKPLIRGWWALVCGMVYPAIALADVKAILNRAYSTILGDLFPILGALALLYATIKACYGDADGKERIKWALLAAFVGFASKALIDWVQTLAR